MAVGETQGVFRVSDNEVQKSDLVDIAATLIHDYWGDAKTGKKPAYLVSEDGGKTQVWLPKSIVEWDGKSTFTMPSWLASKKGFAGY